MSKNTEGHGTSLAWLLEPDEINPGVRYFALRDLLHRPTSNPEVIDAQRSIMRSGPVPAILDAQSPEGYWVKPGAGYTPKYRGTVWSLMFLAQFGADGRHDRVRSAIEYVFDHTQADSGAFSWNGRPDSVIQCLWGNLVRAILDLQGWGDPRLKHAVDTLARSITGDGYERYHPTRGLLAPGFACSCNSGLPCAWGAVRALWALARVPAESRTPEVEAAIGACARFLLSYSVARADYPADHSISPRWFEFGYPLAYITDVLLNLEALTEAGYAHDRRLGSAATLVESKRDDAGRWKMELTYRGRMWVNVEKKGRPSKWITLRALRVLDRLERNRRENPRSWAKDQKP